MSTKQAKGIGYGTAFAIIVLTLVILMGTYYILKTYSTAQVALQDYAEALQKPQIIITGYDVKDNTITVHLVNRGPGAVIVNSVKLYKEDTSGVPTGTVKGDLENMYIPVGGSADVHFTVSDITDYVFWNRPIRVLIETNKGLMTESYPTLTGIIYVNIHLPTWFSTLTTQAKRAFLQNLGLVVSISGYTYKIDLDNAWNSVCSNPVVSNPQQFFRYSICMMNNNGGGTVVIALESIAGIEYRLELSGQPKVPYLGYEATSGNEVPEGQEPHFRYENINIYYSSIASVAPGARTEVTFTIPDVFYKFMPNIPMENNNVQSAWTIDFTWLYDMRGDSGGPGKVYKGVIRAVGQGYETDICCDEQRILTIAGRIVYTGLVTYSNPYGCDVYPRPVPPNQIHPAPPNDGDFRELIQEAYKETFGSYSLVTGLPILIHDFRNSCEHKPDGGKFLDVDVKVPLNKGNYVVIPVFGYNDKDDAGKLHVNIGVEVRGPHGEWVDYKNAIERENVEGSSIKIGPMQNAFPFFIKASSGGVYHFHFQLYLLATSKDDADLALYISKIIVIPTAGSGDVCLYQLNFKPSFPWVLIDTSTGTIYDYAYADVIAVYKPDNIYKHSFVEAYSPINSDGNWHSLIRFAHGGNYPYYYNDANSGYGYGNLSSWNEFNYLPDDIKIEAKVTRNGDNRFQWAMGYSAVDIGNGVLRSPLDDSGNNPLYYEMNDIMRRGYTFVVVADYYYYDANPNKPDKLVQVSITLKMPYSWSDSYYYYIFVPYYFYSDMGEYSQPPKDVDVRGGTALVGSHPPDKPTGQGELLVVEASPGSTVTITFTLPTPLNGSIDSGITDVYSFLGIGGIAVVKNPDYWLNQYNKDGLPQKLGNFDYGGIYLMNVKPVSSQMPVYIKLFDEDGGLIWHKSVYLSSTTTLQITQDLYNGYEDKDYWEYPFKNMYVVIENAKCTMQGQSNTVGSYTSSSISSTSYSSTSVSSVSTSYSTASKSSVGTASKSSTPVSQYVTVTVRNSKNRYVTLSWIPIKVTSSVSKFWSYVKDGSDIYVTTGSGSPVKYMVAYFDKAHKYAVIYVYYGGSLAPGSTLTYKVWFGGVNKYASYRVSPTWSSYYDSTLSEAPTIAKRLYTRVYSTRISLNSIVVKSGIYSYYRTVNAPELGYFPAKSLKFTLSESGAWSKIEFDVRTVSGAFYKIIVYTFNANGPEVYVYKNGVLQYTREVGQLTSIALNAGYSQSAQVAVNLDSPITEVDIVPLDGYNGNVKITVIAYTPVSPEHVIQGMSVSIS
jgi:hypothetical protein